MTGLAVASVIAGCSRGPAAQTQPGHAVASARPGISPTQAAQHTGAGTAAATTSPAAGTAGPAPGVSPTLIPVPAVRAGLRQTRVKPSARASVFAAEMTDLWAAVVTGKSALGRPAFFPLSAYRQVKAIVDPAADWHDRLIADFRLDVGAAHALLGRRARQARLVRVIVPSAQASWIPPGVCANGVGYWHVAGARVLYRARGQLRSIGIASLISWRGRWYVVHFGAVLRSAYEGVVYQPSRGSLLPTPPGGC
jgi:hypothetical protein